MQPERSEEKHPSLLLVSVLFLASGGTTLCYETVWLKRFGQVWGSSALSLATVVACFLFGLALGARLAGPLADRLRRPLLVYGICEVGIGLLALAVPWQQEWIARVVAEMYPLLEGRPPELFSVRILLTLAVLLPPCVLMGATLPLLVRLLTLAGRPIGTASSWLYALNALGAAAGAYLAGFQLLPLLGVSGTNRTAAALGIAIGLAAIFLDRRPRSGAIPSTAELAPPHGQARGVLVAAFLAGFGSLVLQMTWARELALLVGGTTYATSALLVVFIAGIGAGSLGFHALTPSDRALARYVPVGIVCLAAAAYAGVFLSPALALWVGRLRHLRGDMFWNGVVCTTVGGVLLGLSALVMGFLFPALVQLARRGPSRAARTVARVYAWNTAGTILGALATAPLLIPALGTWNARGIAVGSYGLSLLALILAGTLRISRRAAIALLLACLAAVAIHLFGQPDPLSTNLGLYVYGTEAYAGRTDELHTLFFREGATSNVLVLRDRGTDGIVTIRVNGKIDGSDSTDMETQLGSAWLPLLLRPAAREVLVIGFGTGTTVGAALQFQDTRVECVEIEPAMVDASPYFHGVNYRPEHSPRFRLTLGDARSHVQGTDRRYDIIVSEPSNPWIAGVADLYTQEFFTSARAHLVAGGILAQWLQAYGLSETEFALILRTLRSVFRHVMVFRLGPGDTLLIASAEPVEPVRETLAAAQARLDGSPRVLADMQRTFGTTRVTALLLGYLQMDADGIERFLRAEGGDGVNTDRNLRLEFDAPRHAFGDAADRPIRFEVDIPLYQRLMTTWGDVPGALDGLECWLRFFATTDLHAVSVQFAALGYAFAPDDPRFLVPLLTDAPEVMRRSFPEGARHLVELSPEHALQLARELGDRGDELRARAVYAEILRADPDNPEARRALQDSR